MNGDTMATKRQEELRGIADGMQAFYLAGQIDEVESMIQPFRDELTGLTSELHQTRAEMRDNANRVVWAVATAAITLAISSIGVIVTVITVGG